MYQNYPLALKTSMYIYEKCHFQVILLKYILIFMNKN